MSPVKNFLAKVWRLLVPAELPGFFFARSSSRFSLTLPIAVTIKIVRGSAAATSTELGSFSTPRSAKNWSTICWQDRLLRLTHIVRIG